MSTKLPKGTQFGYWLVISADPLICLCTGCNQVKKELKRPSDFKRSKSCGCKRGELMRETTLKRYGVENAAHSPEIRKKIKQTNMEKYGGPAPLSSETIKEKVKETNIEKYGVSTPLLNSTTKEKIKKTTLQKYGVEHNSQAEEIKEKKKNTSRDKYGVDSPFQALEVKEQIRKTNLERYKVANPMQNPEVVAKMQQTKLQLYGSTNHLASEEYKKKTKEVLLEKYGVEHPQQLEENRYRLRDWCMENEKYFISNQEKELFDYLSTLYADIERYSGVKEIDIFIPSLGVGIEFNGLYWHSEGILKNRHAEPEQYHLQKTAYFEKQGITLIHIWGHEWSRDKERVKKYLTQYLNREWQNFKDWDTSSDNTLVLADLSMCPNPAEIPSEMSVLLDHRLGLTPRFTEAGWQIIYHGEPKCFYHKGGYRLQEYSESEYERVWDCGTVLLRKQEEAS